MLILGLHPELDGGTVAIGNELYDEGREEYGYNWVTVSTFPDSFEGERFYKIAFAAESVVLYCYDAVSDDDVIVIELPYEKLAEDRDAFLGAIDAIQIKVAEWEEAEYREDCEEEENNVPGTELEIVIQMTVTLFTYY